MSKSEPGSSQAGQISTRHGAQDRQFSPWRLPAGVWVLGLVSMLMDVSSELIHALLPVYLTVGLGASMLAVGVIEGIAEATASIVKVFSGALSDRLGRRKGLVALGYGLAAVTKPVFALAPSIGWIVAARFVDRLGKGIRGAPRDALIADITVAGQRGSAFGLRQSLDTLGAFIGPLLAIALMWYFANDFRSVFWIAAIPAFLAFGLILVAVKEPERKAAQARADGRGARSPMFSRARLARLGPAYWWIVFVAAMFMLARFSEAFLILRAEGLGLGLMWVPLVLVAMNIVYALSAWPLGALSDRVSRTGLLAAGLVVLMAAHLLSALADNLLLLGFAVMAWGLHMGLTQGLLAALVAQHSPAELRGTAFGMFHLVTGIALLASSLVAGGLWDGYGPRVTFLAGAMLSVLGALAVLALARRLHFADS